MTDKSTDSFWRWSQCRYALQGAETLLLKLQDHYNCNVNILMWSCWCAEYFEETPELLVRKAIDLTSEWNENVTGTLRKARRYMKQSTIPIDGREALRADIKKLELTAEQIEQELLEHLALDHLSPAGNQQLGSQETRARRNLAAYATVTQLAKQPDFSTSMLHDLIDTLLSPSMENGAAQ